MRVKICGITSFEDAMSAIDSGADALGFVFYEKSPRYITPLEAAQIIHQLPPFVEKVGLFVNQDPHTINELAKTARITLAQLHFDVDDTFCDQLQIPSIKVIRAQEPRDILKESDSYRLVDAYCEAYGGVGKRLNLEWFKDIDCSRIILAGGLTPDNVKEALPYGFFGLDVSSGVEVQKGVKDPLKVASFIKEAKC